MTLKALLWRLFKVYRRFIYQRASFRVINSLATSGSKGFDRIQLNLFSWWLDNLKLSKRDFTLILNELRTHSVYWLHLRV